MISPEALTAPPSLSSLDDVQVFWAQRWSGPKLGWHKDDVNPHLTKYTDLLLPSEGEDNNRIFVPLCGKSVDLAYLASHPKVSHVVGVDIVRSAAEEFASDHPQFSLEEFQRNECEVETQEEETCENADPSQLAMSSFHGEDLTILIGDLFDFLSMDSNERAKYMTEGISSIKSSVPTEYIFDTIYDRASIVAIKPSLRKDYVTLMGELLKPGGVILLVTLDRRKTTTDAAKNDGPPFSIGEAEMRQLYESQPWVESVTLLEEVNDLTTDGDRERWEKKGVLELYEIVFLIRKKK
mmetsp:Transcript_16300/g.28828  ORF Transcript_16300/g.28828 Transcript_16300/m.28828 type:complete len:295 (+) Transcript_16300:3-887(+)